MPDKHIADILKGIGLLNATLLRAEGPRATAGHRPDAEGRRPEAAVGRRAAKHQAETQQSGVVAYIADYWSCKAYACGNS